jgi:CHASE2 domain-containing sensor protein/class 3 adenylate cyclase
VKLKPFKLAPALIAVGVIVLFCVLRLLHLDFSERLEKITYDWRVRQAIGFPAPTATNLAFVYIDDASIAYLNTNRGPHSLNYHYGLYWPRLVYGRLVRELSVEKAKAVGLDVIFGERRPDHPATRMPDGTFMESDDFFALQLHRASNVIIAVTADIRPVALFATNAMALGDINTDKDSDGILRRVKAFRTYKKWHPAYRQVAADPDFGVDLDKAIIQSNKVILPRSNGDAVTNPPVAITNLLDSNGNFDVADFGGTNLPPGVQRYARPFTEERIWHMGIVLAAQELKLDLTNADVNLADGRIVLRGANGVERILPVDKNGYFYVDWRLRPNDPHVIQAPIQDLLLQDAMRMRDETNELQGRFAGTLDRFADKLVVVGSTATGNDLRDEGATPLDRNTFLVSKHWNVANSVITGRFVRRSSMAVDLLIIVASGITTAFLIWHLPIRRGTGFVIVLAIAYIILATVIYIQYRYWLPLVLPLGVFVIMDAGLATWRAVFEQAEQRRVKSVFSRVVSPNVMLELLQTENLALGGSRREVTILFADVRGFTEFTDKSQEKAEAYIAEHKLSKEEAEAYYDEQAQETFNTVNTYLALVADQVKKHDGTLDKYIGDCVMAFWGAPLPMANQALCCVRAAIDAQRAVFDLNKQRLQENERRGLENMARASAGLAPKPILPILLLGTGINTGLATAGKMGSEQHQINYTVFGRK